jgi:hypothetical protein
MKSSPTRPSSNCSTAGTRGGCRRSASPAADGHRDGPHEQQDQYGRPHREAQQSAGPEQHHQIIHDAGAIRGEGALFGAA